MPNLIIMPPDARTVDYGGKQVNEYPYLQLAL